MHNFVRKREKTEKRDKILGDKMKTKFSEENFKKGKQ